MKAIKESDYNPNMGILIDVRDPISYQEKHHPGSINIYYDKLLYGYDVTYVINSWNLLILIL